MWDLPPGLITHEGLVAWLVCSNNKQCAVKGLQPHAGLAMALPHGKELSVHSYDAEGVMLAELGLRLTRLSEGLLQ
jgi:hypothetical protein